MRIEDARDLPVAYQEQAAAQILERMAAAAPEMESKVKGLRVCPACGMPAVWEDPENGLAFCTGCGWSDAGLGTGRARSTPAKQEPLGCPFCGGMAELKVNESTLNGVAVCRRCEVTMKRNFKGHKRVRELLLELLIGEWNRRYEPRGEVEFDYGAED